MSTRTAPAAHRKDPAEVAHRRAWLSLLLYPFSFAAAFAIGEGMFSWVAEDTTDPAFWEVAVSATPALVVFVVPGVLAVLLGRRASWLGKPEGRTPAIVGATIAIGFVGLNLLSYAAQLLVG